MRGSAIRGVALFDVLETTLVPDERLKTFLVAARLAGGRLRRCSICTVDGQPGYAVTMAFRSVEL